jgi:hypothetical protein
VIKEKLSISEEHFSVEEEAKKKPAEVGNDLIGMCLETGHSSKTLTLHQIKHRYIPAFCWFLA